MDPRSGPQNGRDDSRSEVSQQARGDLRRMRALAETVDRFVAEQTVADHILPLPLPPSSSSSKNASDVDEAAWTDRLLYVMTFLDDPATNVLQSFSGLKGL